MSVTLAQTTLGVCLLLLACIALLAYLRIAQSIFAQHATSGLQRPLLFTYIQCSCAAFIFIIQFICSSSYRKLCMRMFTHSDTQCPPPGYTALNQLDSAGRTTNDFSCDKTDFSEETEDTFNEQQKKSEITIVNTQKKVQKRPSTDSSFLTESIWIPLNADAPEETDPLMHEKVPRKVRFSKLTEVRFLTGQKASRGFFLFACPHQGDEQKTYEPVSSSDGIWNAQRIFSASVKKALNCSLLWFLLCYCVALLRPSQQNIYTFYVFLAYFLLFLLFFQLIIFDSSPPVERISLCKVILFTVAMIALHLLLTGIRHGVIRSKADITMFDYRHMLLIILTAFFAAFYLCNLRKQLYIQEQINVLVFVGCMGILNMLMLLPVVTVFYFWGETPELPTQDELITHLLSSLLLQAIAHPLWLWGCNLTSAQVTSMFIATLIPLHLISSVVFVQNLTTVITGSVLFFLSLFCLISLGHMEEIHMVTLDPFLHIMNFLCQGSRRSNGRRPNAKLRALLSDNDYTFE